MRMVDVCWGRRLGMMVLFAGAVGLAGCGGGLKMAPVSGKVMLDGAPLNAGTVTLAPQDQPDNKELSTGKITNGTYTITTNGKTGAPVGTYKVVVKTTVPGMDSGASMTGGPAPAAGPAVAQKFTDPATTTLKITVSDNPQAGAYDLLVTSQ